MGHILVLWLLQVVSLVLVSEAVPKVPAIIVFGDSSVDAGNNNFIPTIARSNFEPYGRDFEGGKATGRFSNGRIPTDFISEAFGIKPSIPAYLDPAYNISDFATGVTFASAGSGYDNATSDVLSVIPLWQELEYYREYQRKLSGYQGGGKASDTIAESLHLISLGTNDFLENYYNRPNRRAEYSIEQYQDFLVGIATNFVRSLYGLGARKISLGGVPPMGCLPLERTTNVRHGNDCREDYNSVARQFNGKLNHSVANNLTKDLLGAHIIFSTSYDIFMSIVHKPTDYGFESAAVGCCSTGMFEMGYACNANIERTCTDASKFVFWDAFHPSEKTSQIIADYLVKNDLSVFLKVGDVTRRDDGEHESWKGHGGVMVEPWRISIFVFLIYFIIN